MKLRHGFFLTISLFVLGVPSLIFGEWVGEALKQAKNRAVAGIVPPHSLAAANSSGQILLGYDSGPAIYFPQSAVAGSMWGVRFSPLQSCSLIAFSVFSAGGGGSVRVRIFDDSEGFPSQELISSFSVELGGDLTQQVIYLPFPVDVGENEFHVAFELLAGGPPYIAGDDDGGSGHSSYAPPGGGWSEMNTADLTVRAFVRYYGPDEIPPQLVHFPPDAAFAEEGLLINAQLSDFSGISEATAHYSINGGIWNTAPMVGKGETFEARVSPLSAGSTVRYFIEVKDGAPVPNLAFSPAGGSQTPYELPVYAGRQIKYDDGSAEDFFVADYRFDDNRFAVRLTPEVYPAQLRSLRAYVNDTARFYFSVWSDSAGLPGRLISGPWQAGLEQTERGWVDFELPASGRPVVENGDFFLVVQWAASSPTQPGVGSDGALPDGRSFFHTGSSGWKGWIYNDWMLRASYVAVKTTAENRPLKFSLEQNVPNPFNPSTEIRFRLEQPLVAELAVYNVLGQKIRVLVAGNLPKGEHVTVWDGRDERGQALSSGVYFYRLHTENRVLTRRMVLIK